VGEVDKGDTLLLPIVILTILSIFRKVRSVWGVIGSAIASIGFASHLYFMGVLADNNAPDQAKWTTALLVLLLLAFILFLVNVIFMLKAKAKAKDKNAQEKD
jgi:hypothetical protein